MRVLVLFLSVTLSCVLRAADPVADEWCGSGASELPGLWQDAWLQVQALEEFPRASDWSVVSNRVDALAETLTALQLASVREGPDTAQTVWLAQQTISVRLTELIAATPGRDAPAYTQALHRVRRQLEQLQDSFSPAIFRPLASVSSVALKPTVSLTVTAPRLIVGQPAEVRVRLRDAQGRPVAETELIESHTRKLHALLVDTGLEDYHHLHPTPTGVPGEFTLTFTPDKPGDYLLWLNLVPARTGITEAPRVVLVASVPADNAVTKVAQMEYNTHGWRQQLRLDRDKVRAGEIVSARLRITNEHGEPCFGLEPIMGSFAHVVGFMDDHETFLHVHSLGRPPKEDRRSGPEVPFAFVAPKSGELKLFVQTKIAGQELVARFSLTVE